MFFFVHTVTVIRKQSDLKQTFLNDPNIESKVDFTKPIHLLIHGWLGGLDGGNMYLPFRTKNGMGKYIELPWLIEKDIKNEAK